jgi:hypothetical protein
MNLRVLVLFVFGALVLTLPATANTIILPSSCASTLCPGNQPVVPSGLEIDIQQIFDASLFSGITGSITITGIGLEADDSDTATTGTIDGLKIVAETTSTNPNEGCTALPGSDTGCTYTSLLSVASATTLFDGNYTFNNFIPGTFDAVSFATSFTYDPASGENLLLELELPSKSISVPSGNLAIASIGSDRQSGVGGVEHIELVGDIVGSGLVVELNYQTVSVAPEPGTFVLLGAGLMACLYVQFMKTGRTQNFGEIPKITSL